MELIFVFFWFLPNFIDASERDVFAHIFQNYESRIRPVRDESTQTVVTVTPVILSLLELNEQQEYMKAAVFINQNWHDEFLIWNPSNFNGTNVINVPAAMVWSPDLTITTTSLKSEEIIPKEEQMLIITSDGNISLSYPFVLTNKCTMSIDEFPFDTQYCVISMASWSYANNLLTLASGPNFQKSIDSTAWIIGNMISKTVDDPVPNSDGKFFRSLEYTLPLKRKPVYYVWVIIAPTFIITALSIAGLFAPFNNEGDREETVTLGLTTLLTLAVILSFVTGEMPRGTNLPLLGRFVLFEICVCVISMILSICVMFLHHRSTTRKWAVPPGLQAALCIRGHHKFATELNFEHTGQTQHNPLRTEVVGISGSLKELDSAIVNVNKWLEDNEQEETRKWLWCIVFDHVDFILLFGLEVIHAVCYAAIFYR